MYNSLTVLEEVLKCSKKEKSKFRRHLETYISYYIQKENLVRH